MTGESTNTPVRMSLHCSLPADRAFIGLGGALAVKMAQNLGFPEPEADRIGREVDAATQRCLSHGRPANLEIEFDTAAGRLTIRVSHGGQATEIARRLPSA